MDHRTHRIAVLSTSIMCVVWLAGCSTLQGYQRRPDTKALRSARRDTFFGPTSESDYKAAQNEADRKRLRDALVYGKMLVIEDDFQDLERALNGTGNSLSSGSDLIILALNGLGATTGGTATKSALSAASAGIVGAQGAVSKDLYYQRTLPALLAQMEANHEKIRAEIIGNLKQSDADYPLSAAELDLIRLAKAGSVPSSVSEITQQAVVSKNGSEAKIQQMRELTFANQPDATQLRAWLSPGGVVDKTRYALLQAWLNKQPEPFLKDQDYPPAAFVSGDTADGTLESIRQRALQDPILNISQ